MQLPVEEQVVQFYRALFERIFSKPFAGEIERPLDRGRVTRRIEELADAASQSLTFFFASRGLTKEQASGVLSGLSKLGDLLKLSDVERPGVPAASVIKKVSAGLAPQESGGQAGADAIYRLAQESMVENLLLVGPVMKQWQKLKFSETYEPPRRLVGQLNQQVVQKGPDKHLGREREDENYDFEHRSYLLRRFARVNAGTVQMTTNLINLQALFVMPRVLARPRRSKAEGAAEQADVVMSIAEARKLFGAAAEPEQEKKGGKKRTGGDAVEYVTENGRSVIVGTPGSGKSTLLEWLQLMIANAEVDLIANDQQAIPLLLRVRELDPKELPRGAQLVEAATGSEDHARLMPEGWLDRQMKAGRVLFMLDGLDETDPESRDGYIIPWLDKLCEDYPDCRYVVSSRPAGYPPGTLRRLDFLECDLQDFDDRQIADYTRHWHTAIRLSQGQTEDEARRKGAAEGDALVKGFKGHPYIKNLARNPLMLSAICLVKHFEKGELPEDRALLYRLCVEGLLHKWDSTRGIPSSFSLEEKLRACRQVAIAMQADDRAEYEADKVLEIFKKVLGSATRARALLEHVRYRTGVMIERRAGFFAFAHLTFQEYLAARAVHEGNFRNIDADQLARQHADPRWNEVIALYCGLSPAPASRAMLERLMAQDNTRELSSVLAEAYFSSGTEVKQDEQFRRRVIDRVAASPTDFPISLERFSLKYPEHDIAQAANATVGAVAGEDSYTEAFMWLVVNPRHLNEDVVLDRLAGWRKLDTNQILQLAYLAHRYCSDDVLLKVSADEEIYTPPAPEDQPSLDQVTDFALLGLALRHGHVKSPSSVYGTVLLRIFRGLLLSTNSIPAFRGLPARPFLADIEKRLPKGEKLRGELASLGRQLSARMAENASKPYEKAVVSYLNEFADSLEQTPRRSAKARGGRKVSRKVGAKKSAKRAAKKAARRGSKG